MGEVACRTAASVGYHNAGTIEFLVDKDRNFYFLEMNTRLQVEHPATEMITGIDIVKEQIRIARGRPLRYRQEDVKINGWALECRINAEDPVTFAPSPGRITGLNLPGGIGVRVDTAAYTDGVISPYYDSLVAKLITYGHDRSEAIARMKRALETFVVEGIHTSIPLHQRILADPDFLRGSFDTNFVRRFAPNNQKG
jgi:acetyl-CoA carboxylase biotin carboxylase subunit